MLWIVQIPELSQTYQSQFVLNVSDYQSNIDDNQLMRIPLMTQKLKQW